jgi:hypothetical protein
MAEGRKKRADTSATATHGGFTAACPEVKRVLPKPHRAEALTLGAGFAKDRQAEFSIPANESVRLRPLCRLTKSKDERIHAAFISCGIA